MRHMGAGAAQSDGRFRRPAHRSIWNGLARERTAENGRVRMQLQVAALDDDTSPENKAKRGQYVGRGRSGQGKGGQAAYLDHGKVSRRCRTPAGG